MRFTRLKVWKIMPIRLRISRSCFGFACRTLTPSIVTSPSDNGTRPLIALMRVDLPAPESPTMTIIWPSGISSVTFFSAWTPPE